jgi:hypothetical protein
MGQSIAVEWALKEWGREHGFGEWEHTVEPGGYGRECHVWTARTRFGALTIRFTDLLMRRDLGAKLIAEMDKHLVGRLAKSGKWHVHALTTGHDVMITFREEVSLDKVENSIERSW